MNSMFEGIRFVLIGFDSVSEGQYRSELVGGRGIDVGRYDSSCTHVIVHDRVYDDPVCVAARHDGKTLVTELWVEDSLDIGSLADARRILYRPVKDLKGIPGSESLHICLTGYQRQDRDDIMKMVDMMGAQFSKPLIASKVTHLICYKFEGEKYELAKKLDKKLVNHLWLEDCLKAWEILPEDKYNKSGWELELMEAEARDSEEETEPDVGGFSNLNHGSGSLIPSSALPTPVREVADIQQNTSTLKVSPCTAEVTSGRSNGFLSTPGKETSSDKVSGLYDCRKRLEEFGCIGASSDGQQVYGDGATHAGTCQLAPVLGDKSIELNQDESSLSRTAKRNPCSDAFIDTSGAISNSRKIPRKSTVSVLPEHSGHQFSTQGQDGEKAYLGVLSSSKLTSKQAESDPKSNEIMIPIDGAEKHHDNEQSDDSLPQKRDATALSADIKSPRGDQCATESPRANSRSSEMDNAPVMIGGLPSNSEVCLNHDPHMDGVTSASPLTNKRIKPSKTKSASTKIYAKCQRPILKTKTSNNFCSPSDGEVADLSCDVELNDSRNMVDKQQMGISDSTKNRGVMAISPEHAAETDSVNHLCLEEADFNGQSTVKSFAKENMPETPSGIKAGNDQIGLSRSLNYLASETGESQKLLQDEDESSSPNRRAVNVNKKQIINNSGMLTERIKSASSGRFGKKLVAKKNIGCRPKSSMNNTSKSSGAICIDKTASPTEAEKGRNVAEFGKATTNDVSEMTVELTSKASGIVMEGAQHSLNKTKIRTSATSKEMSVNVVKEKEPTVAMSNSMVAGVVMKEKTKGKQYSVHNMVHASAVGREISMDPVKEGEPPVTESSSASVMKKEVKGTRHAVNKTKNRTSVVSEDEKSMDSEKENMAIETGDLNVKSDENVSQKANNKSKKTPLKCNGVVGGAKAGGVYFEDKRVVNSEPVWFILSGHNLQRKEFQQVIRRLRGRVCRDSHHWSYQATHFIVPDPVRRTEKFLAAAAAGRWILKTDYLTASNQAGWFLAEEPFEWHKSSLSEDGAISLEAPRKWRLLRERTGHGAFYGMRILIYGECIAPPLDTLKRAVKAGGGTILATSPPYSRFLNSGVDFAIISPGMPRVDCWVQEFLRHEIPCIVADYLVEYVCKPGYSLERHVLYNTHAWAEKSFANLLSRSEEVVQSTSSLEEVDDIPCVVCGSRDRGDVMLICGDEGGSLGCGAGTHIDCCDPPLEAVPLEDWFCSKCSRSTPKPTKRAKKGSSLIGLCRCWGIAPAAKLLRSVFSRNVEL